MSKKMKESLAIVITLIVSVIALYFTWVYRNLEITHKIWNIITYAWIAFMTFWNVIGLIYIYRFCKIRKKFNTKEDTPETKR